MINLNSLFANGGKTLEKIGLYVVGILPQTGVFHVTSADKIWLTSAVAAVLTGLHVSTPTPKSGPGQL